MLLLVAAPDNQPMWASATLCVHVFYIHCGLVLDSMTQAIAALSFSVAGGVVIVLLHHKEDRSTISSLVLWCALFHVVGFSFSRRRRRHCHIRKVLVLLPPPSLSPPPATSLSPPGS